MTIKAGAETIINVRVHEEREFVEREPGTMEFDDRPVRRLALAGGLTDAQLAALLTNDWTVLSDDGSETVHKGFGRLLRHEAVFAGQDDSAEQEIAEKDAIIAEVVSVMPDKEASMYVQYARMLKQDGKEIPSGTRINWNSKLYKANVALWDREDQDPDHAPTLWTELMYHNGHRIIPQIITAELAFSQGEVGYWPTDKKYYRAKRNGVVHTPAVYPADWEVVAT